MYPGLSPRRLSALLHHGSEELKDTLSAEARVRRMDRHDEPDRAALRHGSGAVAHQGRSAGDGSYKITGQKIFISAGEHDLAENIIHLVLARIEGAPAGTKGISLFIVPKFMVERRRLARARATAWRAASSKRRWASTATPRACSITTTRSAGWSAKENKGLTAMFTMMNEARLGVRPAGAVARREVAYQNGARLREGPPAGPFADRAEERRRPRRSDHRASRRAPHADGREELHRRRARVRVLDGAARRSAGESPDEAVRQKAGDYMALLTPVLKAYLTDKGFETATDCQQIYGGHGYHRRTRHEPVRARCAHHHDLRRRQRRAGARSCRAQAGGEWRAGGRSRSSTRSMHSSRANDKRRRR